jgi:hypothetical protein
MIRAVMFLLLFACCSDAVAQRLFFRKNRFRETYYKVGDEITFRVKGDKRKIHDRIIGFMDDSLIMFRNYMVNPKEITHLYVDEKTVVWYVLRYKYARILLFAGAGYLLLDTINQGETSKETLAISAPLIGAGLLAQFLISKKMRIRGKRRFYIVSS